jgi:hypothetical protein
VRVLACVLVACALVVPSAGATPSGLKLLVREGNRLALLYLDRPTPFRQPLQPTPYRTLAFSGDGRLLSIGGTILGRAKLPAPSLVWAPTGERAAYVTSEGAVVEWTPSGKRVLEPKGWGATAWAGLAWARDGALAVPRGNELWVLRDGAARRVAGPLSPNAGTGGPDIPEPFAWAGGHVLWWRWPGSGSVAADGIDLYEDGTRLGTTLPYRDYVATCGTHVAFVEGRDRESTDDKKLVFDGRDVSGGPSRSWSTPACTPAGRLVAAASRNDPNAFRAPHRAIWQVLPTRRQLTRPPWGWSDEDPRLFPDGSMLFVRSRVTARRSGNTWLDTGQGRVMVLGHGKLVQVAEIGYRDVDELKEFFGPYFGHYDWSQFLAVSP